MYRICWARGSILCKIVEKEGGWDADQEKNQASPGIGNAGVDNIENVKLSFQKGLEWRSSAGRCLGLECLGVTSKSIDKIPFLKSWHDQTRDESKSSQFP